MRYLIVFTLTFGASSLAAQSPPAASRADSMRIASQFDTDGEYAKARHIFQALIDDAPNPLLNAEAERALAISYAFTRECTSAAILEKKVIDFWRTREQEVRQTAFYQEGEAAREAGDICFDGGDYAAAEREYRTAAALGMQEPEPRVHPRSLWEFRLAHDLAKTTARQGDSLEANRRVDEARAILAADKRLGAEQEKFLPFLDAIVETAQNTPLRSLVNADFLFKKAIAMKADQDTTYAYYFLAVGSSLDPQFGNRQACGLAYARATAHDVASAFVRPNAKTCMLAQRPLPPAGNGPDRQDARQ